jgi:mRNA-degrading endonuclease RelE of RelBE toxin-antitoxin system
MAGGPGQEVGLRRGVSYELRLSPAARRALAETLPESVAAAVWQFVSGPSLDDPHRVGKRLRFELEGYYVIKISHRGEAYG